MNKQINIKETLDWYVWAGVTETCADKSDLILRTEVSQPSSSLICPVQKTFTAQTVNTLALKNARNLCQSSNSIDDLKNILANFEGCSLKNTAKNTVLGDGALDAKIMLIGEAPGADEDRIGKPFVGRCGKLLDKMLQAIEINRSDCYITNVLPWRPPGNRTPTDEEIAVCLPFLKRQIELIQPDILLLLGGIALKSLIDNEESISRARGKWLEYEVNEKQKILAIATYHPSYLLRSSAQKAKVWADLLRLKRKIQEI